MKHVTRELHPAVKALHEVGQCYPYAWQLYAGLLSEERRDAEGRSFYETRYPWLWLLSGSANSVIAAHEEPDFVQDDYIPADYSHATQLHAIAAWRATQGIYRFHPRTHAALWETYVDGPLPGEVLERLPEWCVFIELPEESTGLAGFWAYLDFEVLDGLDQAVMCIRFVLLGKPDALEGGKRPMVSLHVPLGVELDQWLKGFLVGANPLFRTFADNLHGCVSLLLYLCASDADIAELRPLPKERVWKGKRRPIMPCAKAPSIYPCGVRVGHALELAESYRHGDATGTGAPVSPHVRRAHWHRFWTGPKDGPRALRLRWLHPILVGSGDIPEVATIHPVRSPP